MKHTKQMREEDQNNEMVKDLKQHLSRDVTKPTK